MIKYTFVVAYLSLHEGEMKMQTVLAFDELDAMNRYLETDFTSIDELVGTVEYQDAYISCTRV